MKTKARHLNKNKHEVSHSEDIQWLWAWVHLGVWTFREQELGLLSTDLSKGNILYSKDELELKIPDCGGVEKISFPDDWKKIPLGLMSLLCWTDIDQTAAFRFGYLHRGGIIAEKIFDELCRTYGIDGFEEFQDYSYNPLFQEEIDDDVSIKEQYLHWVNLRKQLKYADLLKGKLQLQHYYQWRKERDDFEYLSHNDLLIANEQHYLKHLVCALFHQDRHEFIIALLNLEGYYHDAYEVTKGLGITLLCKRYIRIFKLVDLPDRVLEQIANHEKLVSVIPAIDIEVINRVIEQGNIFLILWQLDNLEHGEISRKDLTAQNDG